MPSEEFIKLKEKIAKEYRLIEKHTKQLLALKRSCTHEVLIPGEAYHHGGYDHTAYTRYWDECELCGTQINVHVKDHGTHG